MVRGRTSGRGGARVTRDTSDVDDREDADLCRQVADLTRQVAVLTARQQGTEVEDMVNPFGEGIDQNTSHTRRWELGFKIDISDFDGSLKADALIDWLSQIEEVMDFKEVPEERRVALVTIHLRGRAQAWWQQVKQNRAREVKDKVQSLEKFKRKLRKAFLPYNFERELYQRRQNLRQEPRSVDKYTDEFYQLLARTDVTESLHQLAHRTQKVNIPDFDGDMEESPILKHSLFDEYEADNEGEISDETWSELGDPIYDVYGDEEEDDPIYNVYDDIWITPAKIASSFDKVNNNSFSNPRRKSKIKIKKLKPLKQNFWSNEKDKNLESKFSTTADNFGDYSTLFLPPSRPPEDTHSVFILPRITTMTDTTELHASYSWQKLDPDLIPLSNLLILPHESFDHGLLPIPKPIFTNPTQNLVPFRRKPVVGSSSRNDAEEEKSNLFLRSFSKPAMELFNASRKPKLQPRFWKIVASARKLDGAAVKTMKADKVDATQAIRHDCNLFDEMSATVLTEKAESVTPETGMSFIDRLAHKYAEYADIVQPVQVAVYEMKLGFSLVLSDSLLKKTFNTIKEDKVDLVLESIYSFMKFPRRYPIESAISCTRWPLMNLSRDIDLHTKSLELDASWHLSVSQKPNPRLYKTPISLTQSKKRRKLTRISATFERFTERAIKAIIYSQKEAKSLGKDMISTQHILLGLIAEDVDQRGFLGCKITIDMARQVVKTIWNDSSDESVSSSSKSVDVPFSSRMKRVFEATVEYSRNLGCHYIASEHISMGLFTVDDGNAEKVLKRMGANVNNLADAAMFRLKREFASDGRETTPVSKETKEKPKAGKVPSAASSKKEKEESSLAQFCVDLTARASEGLIDPVIGREIEVERITQILCRKTKRNPILLGEAGVGKTAIVEGLAIRIAQGKAPAFLLTKCIMSLDVGLLMAGAKERGERETRVTSLISEIQEAGNVILFIDEVHTLVGSGTVGRENNGSGLDTANLLKPSYGVSKMVEVAFTLFFQTEIHHETPTDAGSHMGAHFSVFPITELVQHMQGRKYICGITGDDVNDASALTKAVDSLARTTEGLEEYCKDCAESQDYSVKGMLVWCTLLYHGSGSNHVVSKMKYHLVIHADKECFRKFSSLTLR